ncbi:hypothetical protein QUF76_05025 [Desulfobacterales bacterium HSG16]|nr:hypothetical protein [Desulfobacterales bacterium HSG16]
MEYRVQCLEFKLATIRVKALVPQRLPTEPDVKVSLIRLCMSIDHYLLMKKAGNKGAVASSES